MAAENTSNIWPAELAPFTQEVVTAMQRLYPEEYADKRWDNVGLLLGNTQDDNQQPVVLVTTDLTWLVAQEAIRKGASVIISYHPIIFKEGLMSITTENPEQATLLRLARAGIAVYCPHTAIDVAEDGLNKWLVNAVSGLPNTDFNVIQPRAEDPKTGFGARSVLNEAVELSVILRRLAIALGDLKYIKVAPPVNRSIEGTKIQRFAVCAGSGFQVLKEEEVDLLVMGEINHHDVLYATQRGRTVVQVFHSASERGFLQKSLKPALSMQLSLVNPSAETAPIVLVSECDREPFTIFSVDAKSKQDGSQLTELVTLQPATTTQAATQQAAAEQAALKKAAAEKAAAEQAAAEKAAAEQAALKKAAAEKAAAEKAAAEKAAAEKAAAEKAAAEKAAAEEAAAKEAAAKEAAAKEAAAKEAAKQLTKSTEQEQQVT